MSKAILVIDMPNCCIECPCYENTLESCSVTDDCAIGYGEIKRLDNCPLKPIPIKKMTERLFYTNDEVYMRQNCFTEYDKGWNACLDEILGGSDE